MRKLPLRLFSYAPVRSPCRNQRCSNGNKTDECCYQASNGRNLRICLMRAPRPQDGQKRPQQKNTHEDEECRSIGTWAIRSSADRGVQKKVAGLSVWICHQ